MGKTFWLLSEEVEVCNPRPLLVRFWPVIGRVLAGGDRELAVQLEETFELPSMTKYFKQLEIYALVGWLMINCFPFYLLINFLPQWLEEKGVEKEEFNQIYDIFGWLNLSLLASSICLGIAVNFGIKKLGLKITCILVQVLLLLVNLSTVLTANFGSVWNSKNPGEDPHDDILDNTQKNASQNTQNYTNIYLTYFFSVNSYVITWSAITLITKLYFNVQVQSQALGICYTVAGIMMLIPNAIYLTSVKINFMLIVSGGLLVLSIAPILVTWKFQERNLRLPE